MDLFEDVDELRARVQEETDECLRLADDIVVELVGQGQSSPKAAELAAHYMQVRATLRRIRRVLVAGVACFAPYVVWGFFFLAFAFGWHA